MIKKLNIEDTIFTHAEILKLHDNDCLDCELLQMLEITDSESEEVKLTEQYREKNISFDAGCWPLELSDEEIEILRPNVNTDFFEE